ncbi:MAG: aldolase/citrate lyase family protein [Dehalococcoidia bacterium]|nr:aldolase/citrate lyase family protein [Dehalococcoidia bacterium]
MRERRLRAGEPPTDAPCCTTAGLEQLVSPALAGVFLPHAVTPQDARDVAVMLRELELQRDMEPGHVRVFPVIDTARGLLRCEDIADAAPRVGGLVFDDDGYARDVQGRPEESGPRMAYARGRVVAAARAFDRLPLAISHGLETRFLAQHGFAGTVIDEARLSETANAAFIPSHSTLARARRHQDAYTAARAEGAWVARTEDEIADAHSSRKASQAIEAAGESEA